MHYMCTVAGLCIENIQSCISPYQQIAVGIPGQSPYGNPCHVRSPYYVLLPDIVFIQATPRPYPDAVLPLIPQQGIYRQSAGDPQIDETHPAGLHIIIAQMLV